MDFNYTEAQQQIRTMVRDFAVNEVAPGAEERDRTGEFDYRLWKKLGDLGIIGINLPEKVGGAGGDFLSYCLAEEEISRVDQSLGVTMLVAEGAIRMVYQDVMANKPSWIDKYLKPIIRGDAFGAIGITEPGAGSDTAGIQTTATLEGKEKRYPVAQRSFSARSGQAL